MLRSGASPKEHGAIVEAHSRLRLFLNTYLVTALNPKGIVFFVAFLPQFVRPGADANQQLLLLAITFLVLATCVDTCYVLFASFARHLFASPKAHRRLNLTGGTLLSIAGVWALFAKRAT